jgi:hypothetical protein
MIVLSVFTFDKEMRFLRSNIIIKLSWIIAYLVVLNYTLVCYEAKHQEHRNFHECNLLSGFFIEKVHDFLSYHGLENKNHPSDIDNNKNFSLIEVNENPEYPLIHSFIFNTHQVIISKVLLYKEFYKERFFPELTPPPPKIV